MHFTAVSVVEIGCLLDDTFHPSKQEAIPMIHASIPGSMEVIEGMDFLNPISPDSLRWEEWPQQPE
jgi:hypothetical protein